MATCFSVVRGKRVRVTTLGPCGEVVTEGESEDVSQVAVSEGFIQVAISSVLESGDEFVQKNANGKLCINERSPDALKRLNVVIDWCEVDPDIISMITGFPVELDSDESVGFRIQEGETERRWALEVWTGLGGDQCGPDGQMFGYLLLPQITGATLGDVTIMNGAATFQTTGYTQGFSQWGVGPYPVIGSSDSPTVLDEPIGPADHALLRVTTVPPPDAECGASPVSS